MRFSSLYTHCFLWTHPERCMVTQQRSPHMLRKPKTPRKDPSMTHADASLHYSCTHNNRVGNNVETHKLTSLHAIALVQCICFCFATLRFILNMAIRPVQHAGAQGTAQCKVPTAAQVHSGCAALSGSCSPSAPHSPLPGCPASHGCSLRPSCRPSLLQVGHMLQLDHTLLLCYILQMCHIPYTYIVLLSQHRTYDTHCVIHAVIAFISGYKIATKLKSLYSKLCHSC